MKRAILLLWVLVFPGCHMAAGVDSPQGQASPKQVGGLKAFHRAGQTFLTFADPEDTFGDKPTWGQVRQYRSNTDRRRKVRYRVYRHDRPITDRNIGRARLLAEV